ncbi:MAG TPA: heterodisulfide reductase-related iron-sulfur binding cluster [Myxococcaceae bacterium]|nr:heterodisulfide reductase-related iron-sulfur binding cluster [Myxococcaceae bacterium]
MAEREPIEDCVHCGFCLPHCPTYQSWGEEMDSPRGRIDLMRGLRDGKIPMTPTVARHFDQCLGCLACVTACPSGVKYDVLIEETRAKVERTQRRPLGDRLFRGMVFALFPHPWRLRVAGALLLLYARSGLRWLVRKSGILRLLPLRLRQMEALTPELSWAELTRGLPERVPAVGPVRARVGVVAGCVQRVFFPGVNDATLRVLAAEGCEVLVPPGQGCCGALSMHSGREEESLHLARALIERFERTPVETIVINSAGCGSHLKDYARLFRHDPAWAERAAAFTAKVKDVHEFLVALGPPRATRHPIHARVAYHDACHLAHGQRIRSQPRLLLRGIPGIELVDVPDGEQCCGSAGTYNLFQPASADEIGARKVAAVLRTRAQLLAAGNPGCTLHIQRLLHAQGIDLRAAHPVELLDASIRGVGLPAGEPGPGSVPASPPAAATRTG